MARSLPRARGYVVLGTHTYTHYNHNLFGVKVDIQDLHGRVLARTASNATVDPPLTPLVGRFSAQLNTPFTKKVGSFTDGDIDNRTASVYTVE